MQHLQPGATLQGGKYRIESVIGKGGFGNTYIATDSRNTKVAIKEFFVSNLCDRNTTRSTMMVVSESNMKEVEHYREKFIREARMISKLHHPNIISILDVFEENGSAYYVMEYIEGGSLLDRMRQGAMNEADALRYIRPVADALDYIHKQKICHYDIKPGNIMVRQDNDQPVLIDFGVSKHYDDEDNATTSTPVGISEGYAPLEQYNAKDLTTFSPQTDIYSLGATLLALVTGHKPPTPSDIITNGLPVPTHLSMGTQNAIRQAMVLNRDARTASIDQFLTLLNEGRNDNGDESTRVIPVYDDRTVAVTTGQAAQGYTVEVGEEEEDDSRRKMLITIASVLGVLLGALLLFIILRAATGNNDSSDVEYAPTTAEVDITDEAATTEEKVEPVAQPETTYDWSGTYTAETDMGSTAGGTPIIMLIEMKLQKSGDDYSGSMDIDGYQTMVRYNITASASGNVLRVYANGKSDADAMDISNLDAGDNICTITYGSDRTLSASWSWMMSDFVNDNTTFKKK